MKLAKTNARVTHLEEKLRFISVSLRVRGNTRAERYKRRRNLSGDISSENTSKRRRYYNMKSKKPNIYAAKNLRKYNVGHHSLALPRSLAASRNIPATPNLQCMRHAMAARN
jgi:hypothetical protein